MGKDTKDYKYKIREKAESLIKQVIKIFSETSQGENQLYVSFATEYIGVQISRELRSKFPKKMTIVLEFQFDELVVYDEFFSVCLYFNGKKEKLSIPYESIYQIGDPGINFSFQMTNREAFHSNKKELNLSQKTNKKESKTKEMVDTDNIIDFKDFKK